MGNKLRLKSSKQIELRELTMANNDDKWFIEYIIDMPTSEKKIKDMPQLIYDQMMLIKLLPFRVLEKLDQE